MSDVIELENTPTKIQYKGIIWIPIEHKYDPRLTNVERVLGPLLPKNRSRNVKQNYFIKWLNKNKQIGDVFTLNEFYQECPKHKKDVGCKRRMAKTISDLIKEGKIDQWANKDEFKVLK